MVYKHYIIMLFNHLLSLRTITKVFWKRVRIRVEYLKGEMFLILTLARSFFFTVKKYLSSFKAKAVTSRVQIAKTILLSSNLQVSLLQTVRDKISSLPIPHPGSCIVSYKTLVKSRNISRQMYAPYESENSTAQLMTLGFRNRRQLKCTQSYIKKSFHGVILKQSQRLRKY